MLVRVCVVVMASALPSNDLHSEGTLNCQESKNMLAMNSPVEHLYYYIIELLAMVKWVKVEYFRAQLFSENRAGKNESRFSSAPLRIRVCMLNPWEVTLMERPQPPILFCLRNVSHKIHPS
jgi:hypothetical protein